jgi:hypothetical protein
MKPRDNTEPRLIFPPWNNSSSSVLLWALRRSRA